uniref:Uncharacterized protein n=1 Tax=Arundo donax TaxID=35708 RepID=A0A0A9EAQ7_ARUDO
MAGHCYGPLDPVSNIILNTIWYDAAFPPARKLDLDMVSTLGLFRIEARSMYGLVSFLCTRYHHLNFHRAMRYLLEADGNLLLADPQLDAQAAAAATAALKAEDRRRLHLPWSTTTAFHNALGSRVAAQYQCPATSVNEAFKAAATAAWHPNPDAQATLLTSSETKLGFAISRLQGGGQLSSEDVQRLARLLVSPDDSPCEKPLLPSPIKENMHGHTTISKKVKAALSIYAPMLNGDSAYELHVVCGVNEQVSGPVHCPESGTCPPEKFYRSHVNFLATLKDTNSQAAGGSVLFFAEVSNDDECEAETRSFCCPVLLPPPCAERVRCLYCDYVGARIVHPIGKNFHGHKEDFEMMVRKEDPFDKDFDPALMEQYYTNTTIISDSSVMAERIGRLQEDRFYADNRGSDGYTESDEDDTDSDYMNDDEC